MAEKQNCEVFAFTDTDSTARTHETDEERLLLAPLFKSSDTLLNLGNDFLDLREVALIEVD